MLAICHNGRALRWAPCIAVDTAKLLAFSPACPGRRTVEAKKTQTPSILCETLAVCPKETHVWTLPSSDARVKDGRYSIILQLHENGTQMFDELVDRLSPTRITLQDTNCRKALEPGLNVAVTLRYLASGDRYPSLSYSFRVSRHIFAKFIPQVCQAIVNEYKNWWPFTSVAIALRYRCLSSVNDPPVLTTMCLVSITNHSELGPSTSKILNMQPDLSHPNRSYRSNKFR